MEYTKCKINLDCFTSLSTRKPLKELDLFWSKDSNLVFGVSARHTDFRPCSIEHSCNLQKILIHLCSGPFCRIKDKFTVNCSLYYMNILKNIKFVTFKCLKLKKFPSIVMPLQLTTFVEVKQVNTNLWWNLFTT